MNNVTILSWFPTKANKTKKNEENRFLGKYWENTGKGFTFGMRD
jgi:hypothetical protein